MLKRFIFISLFLSTTAFADHCPTPEEIQAGQLNGWQAYTNDNGTPLNAAQLDEFKQSVARFYSIRWLDSAPEGESHCYYYANNGGWTTAFLSKPGLKPDFSSPDWKTTGRPYCDAGAIACRLLDK